MGAKYRILVIDGSRVVRATLAKHLKDDFEVLEEENGESAWQMLMLDAGIDAVVSGIHPRRLEASELLARLRASVIRRLREIPFVLIVSDIDNQVDRLARVTGFITKSMDKPTIIGHLSNWLASRGNAEPGDMVSQRQEKLLDRKDFDSLVASLSFAGPVEENVCLLIFRIDNLDDLVARFGAEVQEMLTGRIAGLLSDKLGPPDHLGRCGDERLAIISRCVDLRHGVRFGKRFCKSLASGQITIHGQKVKLTASVGVASTSDDKVVNGQELFSLAGQRLEQALVCGGNTVCSEFHPACPMHCRDKSLERLLEVMNGEGKAISPERISAVGLMLLPLLRKMDRELNLGLPLADTERRLRQHAGAEAA